MRVCVVGIDPGKHGAVALLCNDPETTDLWTMDELTTGSKGLWGILNESGVLHAYIEKAQAMPHQGVTSMFTYGTGFGKILGWCEATETPYTLIPPKVWTHEMHKGCTGTDPKSKSLQAVRRLFPTVSLKATDHSTKPHSGYIDALLIAEYGRRIFK